MTLVRWANPVALVAGAEAAAELGPLVAAHGRSALVVTDAGLADGSAVAAVRGALATAGSTVAVFAGVAPDPPLAAVRAGVEAAREARADVVVGVGGGSSLDVAKAVAGGLRDPGLLDAPGWAGDEGVVESLDGGRPAPALVQVPTTIGTGAEVSATASLRDDRGAKRLLRSPALWAQAAVLDPAFTRGLGPQALAGGGLECLQRLIGPYVAAPSAAGGLSDALVEATARTVVGATRAALAAPQDDGARGELALASAASQLGWATLGRETGGYALWSLQNALSSVSGAAKSRTLPALLPAWSRAVARGVGGLGDAGRLARIGASVLGCRPDPHAAADALDALLIEWELPGTLAAAGIHVATGAVVELAVRQWSALFGAAQAGALHDLLADAQGEVPATAPGR